MKVYICTDIEGIATLASFDEANPDNSSYPAMSIQMSKEVAAACRGVLKAGVKEIIIEDCHGYGRNIISDFLPKNVSIIRGITNDIFGITGVFDKTFDAIMFVGYHDCAGNDGNPTAHTMISSSIFNIKVNDKLFSEFHLQAYAAAYLGVPSIFLSGDSSICKIATNEVENINTVITKKGRGNSVLSIMPTLAEELIEIEAEKSIRSIHNKEPIQLPNYFEAEITYIKHYNAYGKSHYPNTKLISPHTISFKTDSFPELMRFFYFVL